MGHVPDPGQGERKDGGASGKADASGGHKGVEEAFADPR